MFFVFVLFYFLIEFVFCKQAVNSNFNNLLMKGLIYFSIFIFNYLKIMK